MLALLMAFSRRLGPAMRRRFIGYGVLCVLATALDLALMAGVLVFVRLLANPAAAPVFAVMAWQPVSGRKAAVITTAAALLAVSAAKAALLAAMIRLRRKILVPLLRGAIRAQLVRQISQPYAEWPKRNIAKVTAQMIEDVRQVVWNLLVPVLDNLQDAILAVATVVLLAVLKPLIAVPLAGILACAVALRLSWARQVSASGSPSRAVVPVLLQVIAQALLAAKENLMMQNALVFRSRMRHAADAFARAVCRDCDAGMANRTGIEVVLFASLFFVTASVFLFGADDADFVPLLALICVAGWRLLPPLARMLRTMDRARPYVSVAMRLLAHWKDAPAMRFAAAGGTSAEPVLTQALSFCGLSCGYPGEEPVLVGLHGRILRGTAVAIVGPSGIGKTTFVDTLMGLLEPQAGSVRIDGQPLSAVRMAWQQRIGYVAQDPYIANLSIRENVTWGKHHGRFDDAAVERALELACLSELLASLPQGLDTRIGERGMRLSGGQRQRLAIARAVLMGPDMLVLDEAMSQLDSKTEAQLLARLKAADPQRTLLVVTHHLQTAASYDQILDLSRYAGVPHVAETSPAVLA